MARGEVAREVAAEWLKSVKDDPFESALAFLVGLAIGLFGGAAVMLWAIS